MAPRCTPGRRRRWSADVDTSDQWQEQGLCLACLHHSLRHAHPADPAEQSSTSQPFMLEAGGHPWRTSQRQTAAHCWEPSAWDGMAAWPLTADDCSCKQPDRPACTAANRAPMRAQQVSLDSRPPAPDRPAKLTAEQPLNSPLPAPGTPA